MKRNELTCLELFSGGGGLAYGIESAGLKHVGLVEFNRHARGTVEANNDRGTYRAPWVLLDEPDVRRSDFSSFKGEVNLVAGGPPCQPFSIGGVHRGNMDERNLFPEAARVVREVVPDAFLFENVRGLARESFRPYLDYIFHQLMHPWMSRRDGETWEEHKDRLGAVTPRNTDGVDYDVFHSVISCSDFGAPQFRERLLIVGFRRDLTVRWTCPRPTHSRRALLWDQFVTGQYWERHGIRKKAVPREFVGEVNELRFLNWQDGTKPWVTVRNAIARFGPPRNVANRVSVDHDQHVFIPGARSYAGHSGSTLDLPAKALKAGVHGVPGGENMLILDNGQVRYFTVREAAALQGFPDGYVFSGSWGECMRQIGNAVPVMVAEFFASKVLEALEEAKSRSGSRLSPRREPRPECLASVRLRPASKRRPRSSLS